MVAGGGVMSRVLGEFEGQMVFGLPLLHFHHVARAVVVTAGVAVVVTLAVVVSAIVVVSVVWVVVTGAGVDVARTVSDITTSTGLLGSVSPLLLAVALPRGLPQLPDLTIQRVDPPGTMPKLKITVPPVPVTLDESTVQAARSERLRPLRGTTVVVAADGGATIKSTATPATPVSVAGSKTPLPAASL
jgi:hypothetical protein